LLTSSARVASRAAQVLEIKPRDEFRYGYMLWLDQETAMPLKSQLIDDKGAIVEEILFTEIDLTDSIPAEAIAATINDDAETLAELVEPYLLKIGLVVRTPSGRRATPAAYRHLGHRGGEGPLQLSLE